jgi:hypothetical protein
MSVSRTVLLVVVALLLAVVLVAGQAMILVQQSVLRNSFLLPHVEKLFSTISAPATHEEIITYFVSEMLRDSRVRGIDAQFRTRLISASVKAFSSQWIQDELLAVLNKTLAVLRGRSQELKHTIYLNRRKEVLVSELTRSVGPDEEAEVRAGSGMVPDAVELTDLTGKNVPVLLRTIGQRSILFSLLAIYAVPAVLVLAALQIGRVRWGIVGIGAAVMVSGIAASITLSAAFPGAVTMVVQSAFSGLPAAFSWVGPWLRELLMDAQAVGRTITMAFAGSGLAMVAAGIVVVVLTRKKTT